MERGFRGGLSAVFSVAIVVLLLMLSTNPVSAQEFSWYPSSPLAPGAGVDVNSPAAAHSTAIHFDELVPIDNLDDDTVQPKFVVKPIATLQDLETLAAFDSDLDASSLFFNGGTNLPWLTDYNLSGSTVVWGLRGTCDYGMYGMKNAILLPDAKSASSDLDSFQSRYGNAYISQVRKAAVITVIFSIDDVAPSAMSKLQQMMSVGLTYFVINGEADGNLDPFLAQAINLGTIHYHVMTQGGPDVSVRTGIIRSELDIASLDTVLTGFVGGATADNAVAVTFDTASYTDFGVNLPIPNQTKVPGLLEQLADNYYTAAQKKEKLETILGSWNGQYIYVDRSLYNSYQTAHDLYANYLTSLMALASTVRSNPDSVSIPIVPKVQVLWPSPSIEFSYHLVTIDASGTAPASKYTVVDGVVHNAVIREVALMRGAAKIYDLTQNQEDATYLMAHIDTDNFLYDDQLYGTRPLTTGESRSDTYSVRWILAGQSTDVGTMTAVALDSNGLAIAMSPMIHSPDKVFTSPPSNQLSE